MPFHDLNVLHTANVSELSRSLAFLAELGYTEIAISTVVTNKLPTTPPAIPCENLTVPKFVNLLTRLTLTISDPTQNHRLASLQSQYNLIALRPVTEKGLALCCSSLECDLISLDLSTRLPFILKFKTVASALQRGIRFEICYSPGIARSSDARRNLISGATALIRATRGRGIILSSEAKSALGMRGPWDVINLAVVWGLTQERGKEAICEEARKVVELARLKRESFRGVVDIVYGGEKRTAGVPETQVKGVKRKLNSIWREPADSPVEKPLSKQKMKRRAKKAKLEEESGEHPPQPQTMPILHETNVKP